MALVKAANPSQIFGREAFRDLTAVSRWKGLALVAHAWATIVALAWGAAWIGTWWAWVVAIVLIGGRQLGLAILMHEARTGCSTPTAPSTTGSGNWSPGCRWAPICTPIAPII